MKYPTLISSTLFLFLNTVTTLLAQTMTMDEYTDKLKSVHPLFEKERLTPRIQEMERNSFLGDQDWNVLSSFGFSSEEPVINFAGPDRTDALAFNGGVERVFWKTGGRLSASFSSTSLKFTLPDLPEFDLFPEDWYQSQMNITYMHPLMKNRKGFLDRLQYDLMQYDIDVSEIVSDENQEKFLTEAAGKYLEWVFLIEQNEIIRKRLQLSEEELARTERKRDANLVENVDVFRAEDAVRISEQALVLAESQLKALRAELAILLRDNEFGKYSPDYQLYEVGGLMPIENALHFVKEESRLIRSLDVRIRQMRYARRGFEETTKPDLSIVAQLSRKELNEGFGSSLSMEKTDALVGLQFSIPLGNRTANSRIDRTDLQISQIERQLDNITIALSSVLSSLYVQISEMEKVLELNREQIASAEVKTREELKLYNQGRGDLTFVIQSQDNEQNAKLLYAQHALIYHKLMLEYRSLMDDLYSPSSEE